MPIFTQQLDDNRNVCKLIILIVLLIFEEKGDIFKISNFPWFLHTLYFCVIAYNNLFFSIYIYMLRSCKFSGLSMKEFKSCDVVAVPMQECWIFARAGMAELLDYASVWIIDWPNLQSHHKSARRNTYVLTRRDTSMHLRIPFLRIILTRFGLAQVVLYKTCNQ